MSDTALLLLLSVGQSEMIPGCDCTFTHHSHCHCVSTHSLIGASCLTSMSWSFNPPSVLFRYARCHYFLALRLPLSCSDCQDWLDTVFFFSHCRSETGRSRDLISLGFFYCWGELLFCFFLIERSFIGIYFSLRFARNQLTFQGALNSQGA